jgi:hypothetical protein
MKKLGFIREEFNVRKAALEIGGFLLVFLLFALITGMFNQ